MDSKKIFIDRFGAPLGTPPELRKHHTHNQSKSKSDFINFSRDFKDFDRDYDKDFSRDYNSMNWTPFYKSFEQPLFVNVHQYNCIRRRKLRRDFLDSLMVKKEGYMHESRHRHAMNRLRAPSGRFLTKEEAEEVRRKQHIEK